MPLPGDAHPISPFCMTRLLTLRALCEHCEAAEATLWCIVERKTLCAGCDAMTHAGLPTASHRRVPIAARSVVAALCTQCRIAPAALANARTAAPLCELCAGAAASAAVGAAATVAAAAAAVAGVGSSGGDAVAPGADAGGAQAAKGCSSGSGTDGLHAAHGPGGGVVLLEEAKFASSIMFDRMDFSGVGSREDGEDEGDVVMSRDARFVDLAYFRSSVPNVALQGRTSPA